MMQSLNATYRKTLAHLILVAPLLLQPACSKTTTASPTTQAASRVDSGDQTPASGSPDPEGNLGHTDPAFRWIAHALGGYQSQTYLNCQECFEEAYQKDTRTFEMDFMMTSDHRVVGIHDGQEAFFGLPSPFTHAQFKSSKHGGTTQLDEDDVAELLKNHADAFLITDVKTDNAAALQRLCTVFAAHAVSCQDRLIVQIYNPDQITMAQGLGFKKIIFTLYTYGNRPADVAAFLAEHPEIWGLTMPDAWWSADYNDLVKKIGIKGFVHTVDDPTKAISLFGAGVDGIYTNFLYGDE